jgi:prolyl-tRNA synthetase
LIVTAATIFTGSTTQQGVQRLSSPSLLGEAVKNRSSHYEDYGNAVFVLTEKGERYLAGELNLDEE